MLSKNLIFFGELPPGSIHGASISNEININILRNSYNVTIVSELYKIENHRSNFIKKTFLFIQSFSKFFKKIFFKKFDIFYGVIYLSTFGILKNLFILTFFKIFNFNSKIILHFHRSDFEFFIKRPVNKFIFNQVYKMTFRFIILSDKQLIQFKNYDISKFKILNNTIEYELKEINFKSQKYKLTFLSNFIYEKGVIETIKSVIDLKLNYNLPISLYLYGSYSNNIIKKEIEHLIKNFDFISINNTVTGIDKLNVIGNSDLLILPSYNEGLPLVLLESMSIGIPMIISNVGYIQDALDSNYPFFCMPGDVESISKAIIKYYNYDSLKRLKFELIEKYKSTFSNHKHSIDLLNIFNFEN